MLKKVLMLALLFPLFCEESHAQNYVNEITKRSCECIKKVPDNLEKEPRNLQLGLCLFKSFSDEDKVQFKKDFNLDLNNPSRDANAIGVKIGTFMAAQCPDQLMRLAKDAIDEREGTIVGSITKIDKDGFVVFSVKDKNNVSHRLLWINKINSDVDLPSNYQALIGQSFNFTFESKELFDPKIGEYRSFKVLTKLMSK